MSQTSQRPKKVGDLVSDKIDLSRHVASTIFGVVSTTDPAIAAVASLIRSDRRVPISVQINLDNNYVEK